ncbi:hypothetical protein J5N97_020430 [Dioscorea zingiberensis]|uniref:Uncharacterized protein n=1 Tax=Dioscorea zingiberensis TaxID=325984 RepID=A0A9D5CFT4_9LILI|nr:hypothetical protein J5N97_020430 [Dioscorea zingiberensis]
MLDLMDVHEEQILRHAGEASNSDNSAEQHHAAPSEKNIRQKKPKRKKITSKVRKDGPPKAPNPVTPNPVTPKPVRKKEKLGNRKNGRKRKRDDNMTSGTMHPHDSSMPLGDIDTQNIHGNFSVRRRLNLNEEGQLLFDDVKSHPLYMHPGIGSTPIHKDYSPNTPLKEERGPLTPLLRRQMLKKQLKYYRRTKGSVNGISGGLFTPIPHIFPCQIDLNKTSSAMTAEVCAENPVNLRTSMNFSFFPKVYKRRSAGETYSPTTFIRSKIFTFANAHRMITPGILEMLSNMLETSRVESTNKRLEISVQPFDLNQPEPNAVCSQLTTTLSIPVNTEQKPGRQRGFLAGTQEGQAASKHKELPLVPYVHPPKQKLKKDVNIKRLQKSMPNQQNALVPYGGAGAIAPYKHQASRYRLVVALDPRNTWLWNCFASKEQLPEGGTFDADTERWWETERRIFCGRAESFLAKIRLIQGNRRFSKWKGSVVDSVVGVFLTQNVSDLLSSSSFMNLVARFPLDVSESDSVKMTSVESSILKMDENKCHEAPDDTREDASSSQNSVGTAFSSTDDPIGMHHSVGQIFESNSNDLVNNNSDRSSSIIDLQIVETKEVEDQEKFLSNCNTRSAPGLAVSPCKNCTQSSVCSEIEDIIGNHSFCQLPREGLVVSAHRSTYFQSKVEHQKLQQISTREKIIPEETQHGKILSESKKSESCINLSENLEALKVSDFHSRGEVENMSNKNTKITPRAKKLKADSKSNDKIDWDILRKEACHNLPTKGRSIDHMDSADWEAVSQADVGVVADAIRLRGQHNILAARIKNFLNRVAKDHGSIDLEWLRNVAPDKAKEYLRSIDGLGLKSVDCVRLLALHFKAFPVDTNVARILVRLGWIPLQPLPESAQLHAIDQYPIMGTVQEYLWPRLWTLDQPTLYELHYQLITFGKVFCTKKNPNCNACPMRNECKHFASAYASAKRLLTGPEEKSLVNSSYSSTSSIDHFTVSTSLPITQIEEGEFSEKLTSISCEPIIEEPPSPEPERFEEYNINYSEDCLYNSDEDNIIEINLKDASQNLEHINQANNTEPQDDGNSNLTLTAAPFVSFLMPALKSVNKFRTKHYVYELPDNHPLLEGMDEREENDEYWYLFAIWKPGKFLLSENAESSEPPINQCNFQGFDELCDNMACFRCNSIREAKSETVRGTLLIPCRTAMRGRFPLNGTYFQVNEVFADNKSSKNPIVVPRHWLWNLPRKICYFGTGISTIFRDLTMEEIQFCMGQGTVCIRGFDRETRRAELLYKRLHVPASQTAKKKVTPEGGD